MNRLKDRSQNNRTIPARRAVDLGGDEQQLHIAELAGYCVGGYIHAADDYVLRSLDTGRFVRDEVLNDPTEAFAEVSQTLFGKRSEEFFGSTRHSWPWTATGSFQSFSHF